MISTHVDVLGFIRCNPHLVLVGLLLHIIFVMRHWLEFIGCRMCLIDDGRQVADIHRAIIVHAVLVLTEGLHQIHKHLRIGILELLLTHDVAIRIARAIDAILTEREVVIALILLSIGTTLQDSIYQSIVSLLIHLGIGHQILEQLQSRLHILVQAAETDGNRIVPYQTRETAGQLIELLLDLSGSHLIRT